MNNNYKESLEKVVSIIAAVDTINKVLIGSDWNTRRLSFNLPALTHSSVLLTSKDDGSRQIQCIHLWSVVLSKLLLQASDDKSKELLINQMAPTVMTLAQFLINIEEGKVAHEEVIIGATTSLLKSILNEDCFMSSLFSLINLTVECGMSLNSVHEHFTKYSEQVLGTTNESDKSEE